MRRKKINSTPSIRISQGPRTNYKVRSVSGKKQKRSRDEQSEKANLPGENQLQLKHYESQTRW
jgi:hypothetical protein